MTKKFTKQQIANYRAYERVRVSGRYNMFDPRAKQLAGLDRDEHLFVIENYEALREAAEQGEKK